MNTKTPTITRERRSVGKIGQRRQVVIPKVLFDELGMQEGDFVEFEKTKDRLVIKRKHLVDAEDTLSGAEAKTVGKGEQQLKDGRSRIFEQHEE